MATELTSQIRATDAQPVKRQGNQNGDSASAVNSADGQRQELPGLLQAMQTARGSEMESAEDLGQLVEDINSVVQSIRRELRFSVEDDSGRTVITVIDSENQEIIRQIPPEEVVILAKHFTDSSGILMSMKV